MPDTASVIPASHSDILGKKGFAHAATTGPGGEPHSSPVWYEWDGELLSFSQTTTRQKYHNLQKHPRIALSITDPENPYRYIEIRGVVEKVDEDPDNAFIDSMAQKYLDQPTYPWSKPDEERLVVRVRPEHTTIQ